MVERLEPFPANPDEPRIVSERFEPKNEERRKK